MSEKITQPESNTPEVKKSENIKAEINIILADFRQKLSSVEQESRNKLLPKSYRDGLPERIEDLKQFIAILEKILQKINQK